MTTLALSCQDCGEDFADSASFAAHRGNYAGGYCLNPRTAGLIPWVVGQRMAWRVPPGGANLGPDDGQTQD